VDTKQLIGARIKAIRTGKKITQEQLSGMMETSSKYLSSIERGKENPTLDMLIKLARSLDVDLGELFAFVQFEDPAQRKQLLVSLANRVGDKHSKLALKILSAVVQEG
jgi:transcriptional regulator with XRE-family HTH domain